MHFKTAFYTINNYTNTIIAFSIDVFMMTNELMVTY